MCNLLSTFLTCPNSLADCTGSADIVFIADSSGSVGHRNFQKILHFIYNFTKHLTIDSGRYRVALITFSDTEHTEFTLATYNTSRPLLEHILRVPFRYGSANVAAALRRMRETYQNGENGNRADVQVMHDSGAHCKKKDCLVHFYPNSLRLSGLLHFSHSFPPHTRHPHLHDGRPLTNSPLSPSLGTCTRIFTMDSLSNV
jgi:hypothetical protein